jgi:N-acetylmuramoyl-L-alanine amidase
MRLMATGMVLLGLVGVARGERLRVVIDAGHGGSNSGAPARAVGSYEKRVTLAVARRLAVDCRARGFDVVMTRTRDEYLTLRERVRRANAARPDVFISLHTNAAGAAGAGSQHGVETWVLARDAADVEARRAATREPDDVQALLAELRLLEAHRQSGLLARAVQSQLVAATGALDRGVRQYGYDVLAGVEAPAVLVEMGFLDHPIEGTALFMPARQQQIATALAAAIEQFADELHGTQKLVMSSAHATRRTTTR